MDDDPVIFTAETLRARRKLLFLNLCVLYDSVVEPCFSERFSVSYSKETIT
jgi:hypothetical protein